MKFKDIPTFTKEGNYQVNIPLSMLPKNINHYIVEYGLQLNPVFQRGHVWSVEQKTAYIEFFLRGGMTGRVIYLNHEKWGTGGNGVFVCVDGLQRLTALLQFCLGTVKAFGHYINQDEIANKEEEKGLLKTDLRPLLQQIPYMELGKGPFFKDSVRMSSSNYNLLININNLKTMKEVLQWYLDLNTGGVIHTESELNRVKEMLKQ